MDVCLYAVSLIKYNRGNIISKCNLSNISFTDKIDYLFNFFFLAAPHGMWDPSSPTRDLTRASCLGSVESYPVDHQGSPQNR